MRAVQPLRHWPSWKFKERASPNRKLPYALPRHSAPSRILIRDRNFRERHQPIGLPRYGHQLEARLCSRRHRDGTSRHAQPCGHRPLDSSVCFAFLRRSAHPHDECGSVRSLDYAVDALACRLGAGAHDESDPRGFGAPWLKVRTGSHRKLALLSRQCRRTMCRLRIEKCLRAQLSCRWAERASQVGLSPSDMVIPLSSRKSPIACSLTGAVPPLPRGGIPAGKVTHAPFVKARSYDPYTVGSGAAHMRALIEELTRCMRGALSRAASGSPSCGTRGSRAAGARARRVQSRDLRSRHRQGTSRGDRG